jgi:molybdate transport system regulatory protein
MNKLSARITSITTNDSLCFLELDATGILLGMVLFDLKPEFKIGTRVNVLFKETEVAIGINAIGELSFCNRFPARITAIHQGVILTHISLMCDAGELASVITTRSVERLMLREGNEVTALLKASQISMEAAHDN